MLHRNIIEAFRGNALVIIDRLFKGNPPAELMATRNRSQQAWLDVSEETRTEVGNFMAEIVELAADPDERFILERLVMINSRSQNAAAQIMGCPVSVVAARTAQITREAEAQVFLTRLFGGGDDGPTVIIGF